MLKNLLFIILSCLIFRAKHSFFCISIGYFLWWSGNHEIKIAGIFFPKIAPIYAITISIVLFISISQHFLYLLINTADRDRRALTSVFGFIIDIRKFKNNNITIPKAFRENVAKNPNKAAIIFEGEVWSFSKIDEYSSRVANFLESKGFKKGESISLLMENRPEYIATWLGCAKVGIKTAFINCHLRQDSLLHSMNIVNSKAVICGSELQNVLKEVEKEIAQLPVFISGLKEENPMTQAWVNFDRSLLNSSPASPKSIDDGHFTDDLLYIYTSGTTGLPKAAIIKHSRFLYMTLGLKHMTKITDNDVVYNPLPMYHAAGGMIGLGQTLINNCTSVIKKKFSASNFWVDAKKYNCTVAQYIGEMCRYLLNSPQKPEEKQHKIRVMYGNGLRSQIWEEFTARFNIPWMCESYGSTEGNANLSNTEGKPGACGFLTVVAPWASPMTLIRVDGITGEPIRGKNGLCQRCNPGEPGVFIGKIRKNNAVFDFHGYADKKATEKKIIRDVFSKGDSAFISGDLMEMDTFGYLYFKDRLGDTFRWKGENVSTTEVEGVISQVSNNRDAVVYGVELPGTEGRAGMAAIADPAEDLEIDSLGKSIERRLPSYARPLFIRILKDIDTTGTFKLKKVTLQEQGFNCNIIKDKMYFLDTKQSRYLPLDQNMYDKFMSGKSGH